MLDTEDTGLGNTDALYASLGARPVINAAGALTILGGSRLSPGVRAAMEAANQSYADMKSLLESSGAIVAEMLDAEAAYITAGAAASLTLSMAACLTLEHRDYLERLPDTAGIPNEVLVQQNSRQRYDECLRFAGARIVEVGDADGLTMQQLAAAIGPNTAAVHYFAQSTSPGTPPIEAVVETAHAAGTPVIVDAAGLTYPIDNLRRFARAGADLVCYAAKYFEGPHSTGLIVGRDELVKAAAINGFIGFETSGAYTIGRPMKVDRQEVFACVVALREWLAMDHEARLSRWTADAGAILEALRDVPGIAATLLSQAGQPPASMREGVRIQLASHSAGAVFDALRDGDPSIWVRTVGGRDDAFDVSVGFLEDGDAEVIARRLREVLIG
jgi:L-seryl-tRNA(Ser) seleniumtransferase